MGDVAGGGKYRRQVSLATGLCRSADGDEDDAGVRHVVGKLRREPQAGALVARHQFGKPRFVDRHLAGLQHGDLGGIAVDAGDGKTELGKTHPCHQPDIAGTDDNDRQMIVG